MRQEREAMAEAERIAAEEKAATEKAELEAKAAAERKAAEEAEAKKAEEDAAAAAAVAAAAALAAVVVVGAVAVGAGAGGEDDGADSAAPAGGAEDSGAEAAPESSEMKDRALTIMDNDDGVSQLAGWLTKQPEGGFMAAARRRWFVLTGDFMVYGTSPPDTKGSSEIKNFKVRTNLTSLSLCLP